MPLPRALFILALSLLLLAGVSRADDPRATLRAVAAADVTEVYPENAFDVTLSLENLTGVAQTVKVPDCGWDRVWRSSNRHVTWDFWDCDFNNEVTVEIPPHGSYVFPKPLKMFVTGVEKKTRLVFRMGFQPKAFKTLWTAPITLDVTP